MVFHYNLAETVKCRVIPSCYMRPSVCIEMHIGCHLHMVADSDKVGFSTPVPSAYKAILADIDAKMTCLFNRRFEIPPIQQL